MLFFDDTVVFRTPDDYLNMNRLSKKNFIKKMLLILFGFG
jgi:hypothetical protein